MRVSLGGSGYIATTMTHATTMTRTTPASAMSPHRIVNANGRFCRSIATRVSLLSEWPSKPRLSQGMLRRRCRRADPKCPSKGNTVGTGVSGDASVSPLADDASAAAASGKGRRGPLGGFTGGPLLVRHRGRRLAAPSIGRSVRTPPMASQGRPVRRRARARGRPRPQGKRRHVPGAGRPCSMRPARNAPPLADGDQSVDHEGAAVLGRDDGKPAVAAVSA